MHARRFHTLVPALAAALALYVAVGHAAVRPAPEAAMLAHGAGFCLVLFTTVGAALAAPPEVARQAVAPALVPLRPTLRDVRGGDASRRARASPPVLQRFLS